MPSGFVIYMDSGVNVNTYIMLGIYHILFYALDDIKVNKSTRYIIAEVVPMRGNGVGETHSIPIIRMAGIRTKWCQGFRFPAQLG